MSSRLPPTFSDCGCCRGEPRTQPPIGDSSKLLWRFKRELCQHCAAAGCEWNFADCIRTDHARARRHPGELTAAEREKVSRIVAADPWVASAMQRAAELVGAMPQEPPGGWHAGFTRLLVGRCPWCCEQIQNIDVSREYGVRWCCLEGCNP